MFYNIKTLVLESNAVSDGFMFSAALYLHIGRGFAWQSGDEVTEVNIHGSCSVYEVPP